MERIDLLLEIARDGIYDYAMVTTSVLASRLGSSQQTVSNHLRELESRHLIKRRPTSRGTYVRVSSEGLSLLQSYQELLSRLLKASKSVKGTVFTGVGEGRFYTQQRGYNRGLQKQLGIRPYPGTLNLKVSRESLARFMLGRPAVRIPGFNAKERTFGALDCYPVHIKGIYSAIIVPERTVHKDTIELVSDDSLRRSLGLKDGDMVEVRG